MMHYVMLCSIHNGSKDVTVVKSTQHFKCQEVEILNILN